MSLLLVCMPIVDLERPHLGLSLLQAILDRAGLPSRILYANLRFAERIGAVRYQRMTLNTRAWYTLMLGEAIFAPAAFPDTPFPTERALDFALSRQVGSQAWRSDQLAVFTDLQRQAAEFVDDLAREIVSQGPTVVGCTSTFQQHVPSLALLRRIRELAPNIITMMGGGNCEARMGVATHRCFPWVDFVVSGEADGLIEPLCRGMLAEGRELVEVPAGVLAPIHRRRGYPEADPRATYNDLESLPYPNFSDYFGQLQVSPLQSGVRVGLPIETSRGCWWGDRHHCTFCGLNGGSMAFRRKSPERALAEFEWLAGRWGIESVEVVDNILDMRYLDTFIPALAASGRNWNIFYEVKSNLKREHLEALARAGARSLQPGIESLDSRVLSLMDKGAKSWQQVQFLKSARELGIRVYWNLLVDFPGECDSWYAEMAELFGWLTHLQPPAGVTWIRFDRFSPYFEHPERYGLEFRPHPMHEMMFPVSKADCVDLSYHFERAEGSDTRPKGPGRLAAEEAAAAWMAAWSGRMPPELRERDLGDEIEILDTRESQEQVHRLRGREAELYRLCSQARKLEREPALETLLARRLVAPLDDRYLALGVGQTAPDHPYMPEFPGGELCIDRLSAEARVGQGGAFERMFLRGHEIPRVPQTTA